MHSKNGQASPHITIDVRIENVQWLNELPEVEELCISAAHAALIEGTENALALLEEDVELTIVLADDSVVQTLNRTYRGQDKPTNVLSFATGPDFFIIGEALALGDIVIALETTLRESAEQALSLADYFRHLVVHGTLHLLGHDHHENSAAEAMERVEARILTRLGVIPIYDM